MHHRRKALIALAGLGISNLPGIISGRSSSLAQKRSLQTDLMAAKFTLSNSYRRQVQGQNALYQDWTKGNLVIMCIAREDGPLNILAIMIENTGKDNWEHFWCIPTTQYDHLLKRSLDDFNTVYQKFLKTKQSDLTRFSEHVYIVQSLASQEHCFVRYK